MFHRRCTYTDDTVCTAAIAYIIVNDRKPDATLPRWCRRPPRQRLRRSISPVDRQRRTRTVRELRKAPEGAGESACTSDQILRDEAVAEIDHIGRTNVVDVAHPQGESTKTYARNQNNRMRIHNVAESALIAKADFRAGRDEARRRDAKPAATMQGW